MKQEIKIIKPNSAITQEDLSKVLKIINGEEGIGVNKLDENNYTIIFMEDSITELEYIENESLLFKYDIDNYNIEYLLNSIIRQSDYTYRLYSDNLGTTLPIAIGYAYVQDDVGPSVERVKNVLQDTGFEVIFIYNDAFNHAKYAINHKDGSVHLINEDYLGYFINHEDFEIEVTDEFSYKVADNVQDFTLKADRALIPHHFYDYYKKDLKILNYSGFDIQNPGRKVFIKPYIYNFDPSRSNFYLIAADGSELLYMDKIRKGESLDQSLIRILKDELQIADDYIGAVVNRIVEFDYDSEGKLTPRLIINVYVKAISVTKEQELKRKQGWTSYPNPKN